MVKLIRRIHTALMERTIVLRERERKRDLPDGKDVR